MIYRNDFVYYSFDFRCVSIYNNRKPPLNDIINSHIVFSSDICTSCFEPIKNNVLKHNSNSIKSIFCEMTGNRLVGNCECYYCVVSKISVKLSGQPFVCLKCKSKTFEGGRCPKCNNTDFIKMAQMNVDDRFVEIMMCYDAYKEFLSKSEIVRKTAGQWTTKSN